MRAALEKSSQSSRLETASLLNPPIVSNASRRTSALVLPKQLTKAPVAASPPRNGRRECSRRFSDDPFDEPRKKLIAEVRMSASTRCATCTNTEIALGANNKV